MIVDLRPESPAFKRWLGVELSSANRRQLYVPEGLAHGFQTPEEDSEVYYQMSEYYVPDWVCGAGWDDPAVRIEWPAAERTISPRDLQFPDFTA